MDKDIFTNFPVSLQPLFWDCDFSSLRWVAHQNFIVRRILQAGNWEAITWLRTSLGDAALRDWIAEHSGGELSPRQLRFWELALNIPRATVDRWVEKSRNGLWEQRVGV